MSEQNKLNHLAIIIDGNRRWAQERGLPTLDGHTEGVKALKRAMAGCKKNNIKYLTVYVFSTENWKRTEEEVGYLMKLAHRHIGNSLDEFNKENIRVRIFGNLETLQDEKLAESFQDIVDKTKSNYGLEFNICFNYGGREELARAIKNIIKDNIKYEDVDDELISQYLYSKDIPDPDMIVRTSGEKRLSNFLPWQSVYSELYFMDMYWPDFDETALNDVIAEFQKRQRRFGK